MIKNKKTALVAGGAGFLGSHFCDKLIQNGWKVFCLDSLITGKEENISHLNNHSDFTFIKHDIVQSLPKFPHLNLIANFACPASPKDYTKFPLKTLTVSSIGTENLLKLARQNNCRFFHTSTSEVYGDPLIHPQKETYWGNVNSYGARSMYDEGKRYAEALIYVYRRKFKINTGIARIFNTYGPRMKANDGRVVSNFIVQALTNKDITIYGTGEQTRSFCYVTDEIEGLFKLATSNLEGPINIGNPQEFTVLELAQKIIKLTNSKSKITFQSLPSDDPKKRQPDIALAKKYLKWQPKTPLEEGLKKTIEWLKKNFNEN